MAFFSQDFVERVRAASELSQVVGSYNVHLKRAGANMLGLCPFHNEKTPSFNVKTTEQFFRCFGCGAKGDVFRFVQMMEKVEFPEAVKMLAERAGLPLEYDNPAAAREAGRNSELKSRLLWCCSRALDYFEECLAGPGGVAARDYLTSRGFEKETISRWRLGWAPDSWDGLYGFLLKSAKEPGQKEKVVEYALQAGVLRAREGDREHRRGYYDAFRGRVMFPILDAQSRPIAFGGRVLVEKEGVGGKYINSPEGRLFEKRKVLFGLTQASKEISLTGEAVVVEGYTDVIMCHQYGIRNVVATLGTSLTEDHVGLLRRYVAGKGRVIAFFDADGAGRKATRRAINLFMEQDVPLAVASGLEMKDAGDFLPKYGADEFRKKLTQCQESFAYVLAETLGRVGGRDPQAMAVAVREALETVNLCPDPITRSLMRQRLAAEAGIPEETLPEPAKAAATPLRRALATPGQAVAGRKARPPVKAGLSPSTAALDMEEALQSRDGGIRRREAKLLRYMWESPEWCDRIMDEYPPDEWRHEALAAMAALIRDEWDAERPPTSAAIQARATHPDIAELLAEMVFPDAEPLSEPDVRQILAFLADENRREELRIVQREMERAQREGDSARAGELLLRRTELRRLMNTKNTINYR